MEYKVKPEQDGVRLDRFLKKNLPELPVSVMHRLARTKKILVNGKSETDVKRSVKVDDVVALAGFAPGRRAGEKRPDRLPVLFEDETLLIIDKPRGLAVHSGTGDEGRTVIDLLRERAVAYEPYLVHRLDKYTSGVMAVAKDRSIAGKLGDLFKGEGGRALRKLYLTVVFGEPPRTGRIDLALDRKPALTRYRHLQSIQWSGGGLSLLEVAIDTGRTHQIRRHLAAVNLPVVGDDEYGVWDLNKRFRSEFKIKNYLLHALELEFKHPVSGVPMRFHAPIPKEIYNLFGNVEK